MFRRNLSIFLALLVVIAMLAACGGGAEPTAAPVPTQPPAAAEPTAVPPTDTPAPAPTDTPMPEATEAIPIDNRRTFLNTRHTRIGTQPQYKTILDELDRVEVPFEQEAWVDALARFVLFTSGDRS